MFQCPTKMSDLSQLFQRRPSNAQSSKIAFQFITCLIFNKFSFSRCTKRSTIGNVWLLVSSLIVQTMWPNLFRTFSSEFHLRFIGNSFIPPILVYSNREAYGSIWGHYCIIIATYKMREVSNPPMKI